MGGGGRAKGSLSVTKVAGGIRVKIPGGKLNAAMRKVVGEKTAKSLEKAAKNKSVLGPGAAKAIVTHKGTNKTFANAFEGLAYKSGQGAIGKGTTQFGSKSTSLKQGNLNIHIRDENGKIKFKSTLEQLRKVAKTKNFLGKISSAANKAPKAGTVKIANPLKSKTSQLSVEAAKSLASSKQKFGQGIPKLSDMQANKNPTETTQKLMAALISNSQHAIAKDMAKISEKLGIRPDLTPEQHAMAMKEAEGLKITSKSVKPLLKPNMSLKEKHAIRDNVRAEAIAKISANQDVGLAKQLLAKKSEYTTKGVLVLVQKNGAVGTQGKNYVPNAETKTINKAAGYTLPAGVHFGSFQTARVSKEGNGMFLIQDRTRELKGEKAEAATNLNRPTTTRLENIGRMFVKAGKTWKEVTNSGLKPVPKGKNAYELVGGEKPPKDLDGPDA